MDKKIIYKELYPWEVFEAVKDGKDVYCLDKKEARAYNIGVTFNLNGYIDIMGKVDNDMTNRFYFWTEITEEVADNDTV